MTRTAELIQRGGAVLGIELGSTRIKAVLIDEGGAPIASGGHDWENRLENGVWTYSIEDVWTGLQDCYASLARDVRERYGCEITDLKAIGVSAMMHGYMAFDENGELLVPFRTWRNTMTEKAAETLTELFGFNIPQRWSIAHLAQSIMDGMAHVSQIRWLTTLSGYVHFMLTGRRALGVGEASGMFPIDSAKNDYDQKMIDQFEARFGQKEWSLRDILPEVLTAGDDAGSLTEAGARLLDPSGKLNAGIPLCPPEGDAGTGMVATNSVSLRTGNVSAGTSIFAMVVLEKPLKEVHPEIDMVTTPAGAPVAMAHCNNCTSDLNAWVNLMREYAEMLGVKQSADELYGRLFERALEGDADCGGLFACNYYSGEHITGFTSGRPVFARAPESRMTLANFMRAHLDSAMATLSIGLEILKEEGVSIDRMYGHGGLFRTKGVGQRLMAAAIGAPVSVMETAGEGGAWGVALLAKFRAEKEKGETLEAFLENKIFAGKTGIAVAPNEEGEKGFKKFIEQYKRALKIESAAVETL